MARMRLHAPGTPLVREAQEPPAPGPGQLLVKVSACGVCRTDLHLADGELPACRYPITPGHEIVGTIVGSGERVGIPWLGSTCGECDYCRGGRENLCARARFTGCHLDGGYAGYAVADERFCLPIPGRYGDAEAAPLLCAGLIGYRSYRKCEDARTDEAPPEPLDAAIIFAPVGALVIDALRNTRKGGRVICGGIHMSDIPAFPYALLWGERRIESVANLTREDGRRFMELAARVPLRTEVHRYPLEQANAALDDLRHGRFSGAAVLIP